MELPHTLARSLLVGLFVGGLSACAPKSPALPGPLGSVGKDLPLRSSPRMEGTPLDDGFADSVAEAARYYLEVPPEGFRDDCSGFVEAVLARAGAPLQGSTAGFWEMASTVGAIHKRRRPAIGDLAFFDNTWDRDGNGRLDDELSHIAVVIGIEADATIVMAQAGTSAGRSILRMNLRDPNTTTDADGVIVNDFLRRRTDTDRRGTNYLASQLWRGFASVEESVGTDLED